MNKETGGGNEVNDEREEKINSSNCTEVLIKKGERDR